MARKKLTPARRRNWLLFVAGCLAVTGIASWQFAFDATTPSAPAPRQLATAAPPEAAAPVAPSIDVAAVAPVKDTATTPPTAAAPKARPTKAPAGKTPPAKTASPVARHDPPAADTVERRDTVVPPPPPSADKSPADVYEARARVSLQKRDYAEARELMELALARGGKATFMVVHDHSRGNFESDDPKATCVGELTILGDEVRFEPREDGDRFAANWSDVRDAGGNRFFGSGRGGFHVSVNTGGKYKNFNLAPESKEKAEAKVILDLLNSYIRRSERTK